MDKIVVRQLEVVDANGNTIAVLGKRDLPLGMADILRVYDGAGKSIILLAQGPDGGMVHVFDKEGKNSSASLGISANAGVVQAIDEAGSRAVLQGGAVVVHGKDGKSGVVLDTDVNGGKVSVFSKNGKTGTGLGVGKNGGQMAIFNNGGQDVLQIGVTDTGGGAVNTKDKLGYITGTMP